jgi:hypothetical protein
MRWLFSILALLIASSPATAQRINFSSGIGYYIFYDGTANLLYFTSEISEKFDDKRVMRIPRHAEFYTFGLDFSHAFAVSGGPGGMQIVPLPPHLAGIGLTYLTKDGKLQGRYMVHFTPVSGYPEKVYRISIPYLSILQRDNASYDYFALSILQEGQHGSGYLFRYIDDEPRLKSMVEGFTSKLGAGVSWDGSLYLDRFAVLGGQPPETLKVMLEIRDFATQAATFKATLKLLTDNKQIAFNGKRLSERELVLTRSDDEKTAAHLFLRGDGTLTGSWQQFDLLGVTSARIVVNVDPQPAR